MATPCVKMIFAIRSASATTSSLRAEEDAACRTSQHTPMSTAPIQGKEEDVPHIPCACNRVSSTAIALRPAVTHAFLSLFEPLCCGSRGNDSASPEAASSKSALRMLHTNDVTNFTLSSFQSWFDGRSVRARMLDRLLAISMVFAAMTKEAKGSNPALCMNQYVSSSSSASALDSNSTARQRSAPSCDINSAMLSRDARTS